MDCQLLLTALAGNEVTASTNVAQFDRFEDFEEHTVDYLATSSHRCVEEVLGRRVLGAEMDCP